MSTEYVIADDLRRLEEGEETHQLVMLEHSNLIDVFIRPHEDSGATAHLFRELNATELAKLINEQLQVLCYLTGEQKFSEMGESLDEMVVDAMWDSDDADLMRDGEAEWQSKS